jgi:hypothetical protein
VAVSYRELSRTVWCQVKVTLRLTVSQSVSLGVEPHLRLMTRYLLHFDSYGIVFLGRPLLREGGSVFCICCWPSSAYSFSGPSHLRLLTISYCLRFETSLFVASYYSQGHGGGIRPRLWVWVTLRLTVSQSVCLGTTLVSRYITSAPTAQKTQLYYLLALTAQKTSHVVFIVACRLTAAEMCLSLLRCNGHVTHHIETVSLLRFVYRAVA